MELAQVPESAEAAPVEDPFGSVGPKLAALLRLAPDAAVSLIGRSQPGWVEETGDHFPRARRLWTPDELEGRGDQALVVWSPGVLRSGDLASGLRAVRRALAPTGTFILLAPNRFALRRIRRAPLGVLFGGLRSERGYRSLLRGAGFAQIHPFLGLPEPQNPEEFVAFGSGEVTYQHDASSIERALHASGLYPLLHESFVYLASGEAGGPSPFLAALGQGLGEDGAPLLLDRFAMRRRGALVMLARTAPEGRRLALRVTTDAVVAAVVGETRRWTAAIHDHPQIPGAVKELVPAPCSDLVVDRNRVQVETLLRGTIGWKLAPDPRLEGPLFASVQGFARDLAVATGSTRRLDYDAVDALLPPLSYPWLDGTLRQRLETLRQSLRLRVLGSRRDLAWNHGDFGYGNVLSDERSGRLTGVIDWDQAREDLAGVDLLNFLLQRARGAAEDSIHNLLAGFADDFLAGGFRALDPRIDFEDALPIDQDRRADLLAWTIWRFLERDLRYPDRRGRRKDSLDAMLDWAITHLGERSEANPGWRT